MYLVFYLDILISSWKKINCPDSIIYYTTYFRGSLAEVFEVVFIIFSKPRGKHFSVYTSLLDKVAQLTFTLAFYKLFQAATLQQKDSSKGFCIFCKIFAISYRTPKSKYFCSFYEILPQQYFSYFIETVALAQPYENGIAEKWDHDPGPFGGTLQ